MRTTQVVTAAAVQPVTLARAKEWLLIDSDDSSHDNVINQLIKAMTEYAENLTNRAFVQRSLRLYLDQWPTDLEWGAKIELSQPPLVSVASVKYRDLNGTLQTLAADQYDVHSQYEPAIIVPAYLATWPSMRRTPDGVQVDYTAGYNPGSPQDAQGYMDVMPGSLLTWIEARISTLFENRDQLIVGALVNQIPRDFADGLLDSLVVGTRLF